MFRNEGNLMKNKRFIVVSSFDNFERSSDNVYKYNGCCNSKRLSNIFDTLEDAISFVNDYNLDISKNRFSLYVENISVFLRGALDSGGRVKIFSPAAARLPLLAHCGAGSRISFTV